MANLHQLVLEHLDSGEEILYSVFGCYKTTSLGSNTLRSGAFFATNMRLIFYGKRSFGFDMEIFPYQNISSIEFGKDLLGHKIRFCTSGNDIRITSIKVGDVTEFTRYVRFAIDQKNSPEIVRRGIPNQILQSTQIGTQDNQTKATLQSSAQQATTEDKVSAQQATTEDKVSVPLSQTNNSLEKIDKSTERTGRDLTICGVTGFLTGFGVGAPLSIGSYLMWKKLGIKGGLRWIAWGVTGFFTVPIIASSLSSIGEKQPVSQQPKQQSISQTSKIAEKQPVLQQQSKPQLSSPSTEAQLSPTTVQIPNNITYKIIENNILPGIKRSLTVQINRKVSEDILREIAIRLKDSDPKKYDRTFIVYCLPEIDCKNGAWATSHFDPDLEVRIQGLSIEQEAKLKQKPEDNSQNIIGTWLDESVHMGHKITVFRTDKGLYIGRSFPDGSSSKNELIEKSSSDGRRFEDKKGANFGEFYLLDPQGNLQVWDQDGLISTLKQYRQ